jgi:hypothetical protein
MFNSKVLGLIFLKFLFAFCINEEVIIHKNDMSVQMQQYVIAQTKHIIESETDLNIAAKQLSHAMNDKYGKNWNCFAGINSSFDGINVESKEDSFIWFSIKEKNFVVLKQVVEIKITNSLKSAQKNDAKVVIIRDGMPDNMKNWILIMVRTVVDVFNDTESISKHIVQILEGRYDYSWFCLIGSTGNDENFLKNAENSTILSLKIESLLITIFQVRPEVPKTENEVIINFIEFEFFF